MVDLNPGRFTGCLYAHLDLARRQAVLATAGRPPADTAPSGRARRGPSPDARAAARYRPPRGLSLQQGSSRPRGAIRTTPWPGSPPSSPKPRPSPWTGSPRT
ncbi:hypothetical protein [Streptomyces sp. PmtA]|uniref:hypothetical protein n=1 Tax=Streptomyces sp. PmtA TaxID=3074275 RepID=UPI0030145FA7